MGVPTFYRYVHDRFPKCIRDYIETTSSAELECASSSDWSSTPNPNAIEFDNVYIDFNGLVHNATHPADRPPPANQEESLLEIFRQIDRIVLAARPRRLLYLALDGVAPRAKMDQQRARRFMAARGRESEQVRASRLSEAFAQAGEAAAAREHFDHNAITPGTEWMCQLGDALRYYLAARSSTPAWRRLSVLLSDASVPGEGEHKVMEFVRQQRLQPGYNCDTTHLIYGLDADLVMLALATHEARFYILRDFVPIGREKFRVVCRVCGRSDHAADACPVLLNAKAHQTSKQRAAMSATRLPYKPLQLLDISVLREYLLHLLRPDAFLPPSRAAAAATPRPSDASAPAASPDASADDEAPTTPPATTWAPAAAAGALAAAAGGGTTRSWWDGERVIDDVVCMTFLVGNDFLPALPNQGIASGGLDRLIDTYRRHRASMPGYLLEGGRVQPAALSSFLQALAQCEEERLHGFCGAGEKTLKAARFDAAEYRAKEYQLSFGAGFAQVPSLCEAHLQGIAWCAQYYYNGCADWRWHYGHHYAPFAADLAVVSDGWSPRSWGDEPPLRPLQQLASVLPPASASLLPASFAPLLTDEASSLAAFFPSSVALDQRGKKHEWQAIVLLPFLPIQKLLKELEPLALSEEERRRDRTCRPLLVMPSEMPEPLASASPRRKGRSERPWLSLGPLHPLRCSVRRPSGWKEDGQLLAPAPLKLPPVALGCVACYEVKLPAHQAHLCALLPSATQVPPQLTLADVTHGAHSHDYTPPSATTAAARGGSGSPAGKRKRKPVESAAPIAGNAPGGKDVAEEFESACLFGFKVGPG